MFSSPRDKQVSLSEGRFGYKDGRKSFVAYIEATPTVEDSAGQSVRWFKDRIYSMEFGTQLFVFPERGDREAVSVLVLSAPSAKSLADRLDTILGTEIATIRPEYRAERQSELRSLVNSGERLVACAQREGGVH